MNAARTFAVRLAAAGCLAFCGCSRGSVERVTWPVMGTVAAVQWQACAEGAGERARARAQAVLAEVERRLNAHDPQAEISLLAALPDDEVVRRCDPRMRPCYEAAFRLRRETGGAFDPRWRGPGTLDLGAIAKGFAVDLAAAEVRPCAAGGRLLLDLGGNLRAVGGEWTAGILDARGEGVCRRLRLRPGEALATSATYYRGRHIADGRTQRVVTNGVESVTVLAPTAMAADGLSTAFFVLGPEEGLRLANGPVAADVVMALWLLADGRQVAHDPDHRLDAPVGGAPRAARSIPLGRRP